MVDGAIRTLVRCSGPDGRACEGIGRWTPNCRLAPGTPRSPQYPTPTVNRLGSRPVWSFLSAVSHILTFARLECPLFTPKDTQPTRSPVRSAAVFQSSSSRPVE